MKVQGFDYDGKTKLLTVRISGCGDEEACFDVIRNISELQAPAVDDPVADMLYNCVPVDKIAESLGLSLATVYRRIHKLGLSTPMRKRKAAAAIQASRPM